MSTIFTLFMVLIMIACVLLIIIIMAQNPKGGGLSGTFGGSGAAQFGVQRTNDFMEKATWTLGIVVVILIILSVVLTAKPMKKFRHLQKQHQLNRLLRNKAHLLQQLQHRHSKLRLLQQTKK